MIKATSTSPRRVDRRVWDEIAEAYEGKDEVVKGTIVARVKGKVGMDIGVKAFLPGSQVDLRCATSTAWWARNTNSDHQVQPSSPQHRVEPSCTLLEIQREALKTDTMDRLDAGAKLTGIIKNLTDYGAFVDLGGIDDCRITDMSWGRINHPSQLFNVGDEVDVVVLATIKLPGACPWVLSN